MSRLHFRDINDWTPASISIVDKPYHPLATFEVYENDEEFIKKFIDPEDENMVKTQNTTPSADDNVTVSGSFLERLLERVVAKSEPTPAEGEGEGSDEVSKQILEKLDAIEENQAKTDERLAALENPTPVEGEGEEGESGEEGEEGEESAPEQVELPLNEDGTLDLENEVVAKYLPRGFTASSQGIDPDNQQKNKTNKSFNARSGRDANGMTW